MADQHHVALRQVTESDSCISRLK